MPSRCAVDSGLSATSLLESPAFQETSNYSWLPVAGDAAASAAQRLAEDGKEQWIQKGMREDKAAQLASDLTIILAAIFKPDFDIYHQHMISLGSGFDGMTDGLAASFVEWNRYPPATPELAADQSPEHKLRYMWNNPAPRRVEWSAAAPSTLATGFGLIGTANSPDWPYAGWYAQQSLYEPSNGRLQDVTGELVTTTKDAAWIMFEGRFQNGMQTRMKINFYYDPTLKYWIPLNVVFGTDGDFRPFPLI